MTTMTAPDSSVARSDADPFDERALLDPLPLQRELREAAPIVYLNRYDVYATGRYADMREILTDWQRFKVGAGVGLANFYKEKPWRPPANPTETDPPGHDAPRRVLTSVLGPRALRQLREAWFDEALQVVDAALEITEFDAVETLATFPLKVFPDAVGLPAEGRENLLAYGDLVFNAFGPSNALLERSAARLGELSAWVTELCRRESLADGGFGAAIWAAANRNEITQEQAPLVVRSLLSAGVDTTVHGITAVIRALAEHPDQWEYLRSRPELARVAFDEAVRWASPLQQWFHTTAEDTTFAGVRIPAHSKILLIAAAANRDPRRWADPDRFDLTRDPSGHLGFGSGIHQCVGQHIARLEAEAMISALARRVHTIEPAGPARRQLNNTLQAWESFPVRMRG
jgi:cytochrome P450